jgi:hypothetical protein
MRRGVLLSALLLAACGSDEMLGSTPGLDAGVDAPADVEAPVEAGPPIRTVELRNPFGNTDLEHNLLVDGDFELSSSNGQFGWRAISGSAQANLVRETGGLCRSGVTCAVMTKGTELLALGAAPPGQGMEVSLWVKPPVPDCSSTAVSLISCTGVIPTTLASVPPVDFTPDPSGWCHHHAVAPATELQPCLVVSSFIEEGQRTLVDDGSILPAPADSPSSLRSGPPTAAEVDRAERVLRVLHESVRFGRAPLSPP